VAPIVKVGDRVKLVPGEMRKDLMEEYQIKEGIQGIILAVHKDATTLPYQVRWDEEYFESDVGEGDRELWMAKNEIGPCGNKWNAYLERVGGTAG
jgi:hypothetical protein